jgi:hypothetical protein
MYNLQFLPYNYANLNSHSGRSSQIRILGNLSDFSKQVCTSSKICPNSKAVLLPGFLFPLLFWIWTYFHKESYSASFLLLDWKIWWILEQQKGGFHNLQIWFSSKNRKSIVSGSDRWIVWPIQIQAYDRIKNAIEGHWSGTWDRGTQRAPRLLWTGETSANRHQCGGTTIASSLSLLPLKQSPAEASPFPPIFQQLWGEPPPASCRSTPSFGNSFRKANPQVVEVIFP